MDPRCSPYWAAAPADMTISSDRAGSAMRPFRTVTRSVEKYRGVGARAAFQCGWRLTWNARSTVVPENLQGAVEADDGHRSLDVGDPGHCRIHLLRVPRVRDGTELGEHPQIRWVGARQVGREGGLRAAPPGHRRHGDAAHQADEDDQGEVAGPAPAEGGPEPVPGLAHDRSDQPDPPAPHARPQVTGYQYRLPTQCC